jgi:hypothetical protein
VPGDRLADERGDELAMKNSVRLFSPSHRLIASAPSSLQQSDDEEEHQPHRDHGEHGAEAESHRQPAVTAQLYGSSPPPPAHPATVAFQPSPEFDKKTTSVSVTTRAFGP